MIKLVCLFSILCSGVMTYSADLRINTKESEIQSNNEWTRFLLNVEGGFYPYSIFYTSVPAGWKQVKDYIYLPHNIFQKQAKYPCRVIITDNSNNQLRSTVVFEVKKSSSSIQIQLFPFDFNFPSTFFLTPDQKSIPILTEVQNIQQLKPITIDHSKTTETHSYPAQLTLTPGSGLKNIIHSLISDQKQTIEESLNRIKKLVQSQRRKPSTKKSIQNIFFTLPSPAQIDQIILSGDSFAIMKIIQNVVQKDNLTCFQKIFYLSDFFGRIQNAIEMKQFAKDQLRIIIEGTQTEIQRLEKEIQVLSDEIKGVKDSSLQYQYISSMDELEQAYDRYNKNYKKIKESQQAVQAISEKNQHLKKIYEERQNTLFLQKQQLEKTQERMSSLQQQLDSIELKRYEIESNIMDSQSELRELKFEIENYDRRMEKINFLLAQFQSNQYDLKSEYKQLEIVVERVRSDIINSIQRENKYILLKEELEMKLHNQKSKLVYRQIQKLQNLLTLLRTTQPNIKEEIDNLYYDCFEADQLKSKLEDHKLIYIMNSKSFASYIENAYGFKLKLKRSLSSEITLTPSNILEQKWKNRFGNSFDDKTIAKSEDFLFDTSFNCLNPSTLENGHGKILSINMNIMKVQRENSFIFLKLSSCSRIQSSNILPYVGQNIYFKANRKGTVLYQVYSATCF